MHVVGEIDLATAPAYRRELIDAAATATDLAVDLTECDLIDSVGLGVTLGGARRARAHGAAFVVVANERIRRTLERCRLDEIVDVGDSLDSLDPRDPRAGTDPAAVTVPGGSGPR